MPFLARAVQCEMCGANVPRTRRIQIDRSILNVGPECERFGKVIEGPAAKAPTVPGNVPMAMEKRRRQQPKDVFAAQEMQLELVEDFAQRIRMGRERKGLTRQELGARVGEREVVMGRIENGALHPTDDVARKLERELGIKLFEPVAAGTTQASKTRAMTLGDMLREAQRKKEGS
jgi:putative transcription factor